MLSVSGVEVAQRAAIKATAASIGGRWVKFGLLMALYTMPFARVANKSPKSGRAGGAIKNFGPAVKPGPKL